MSDYICIKEYPGSPKKGTVVDLPYSHHTHCNVNIWELEERNPGKWDEYWQKVIRDFEVGSSKSIVVRKGHDYGLRTIFGVEITSISRTNDGEEFKLGDNIKIPSLTNRILTIKSFEVSEDKESIKVEHELGFATNSTKAGHFFFMQKVKKEKK